MVRQLPGFDRAKTDGQASGFAKGALVIEIDLRLGKGIDEGVMVIHKLSSSSPILLWRVEPRRFTGSEQLGLHLIASGNKQLLQVRGSLTSLLLLSLSIPWLLSGRLSQVSALDGSQIRVWTFSQIYPEGIVIFQPDRVRALPWEPEHTQTPNPERVRSAAAFVHAGAHVPVSFIRRRHSALPPG